MKRFPSNALPLFSDCKLINILKRTVSLFKDITFVLIIKKTNLLNKSRANVEN